MDVVSVIAGAVLGFVGAFLLFYQKEKSLVAYKVLLKEKEQQLIFAQAKENRWEEERKNLLEETSSLRTLLSGEREKLEELQERFSLQFTQLSQKIFQESSKDFVASSELKLGELLGPLKQKIDLFQKDMQEIHKVSVAERLTLKNKLESMAGFSQALAEETKKLQTALKGDVKKQGVWGELILQKVLEASGLRKDAEYTLQGSGLQLSDANGKKLQPDVVIHLPYDKKIIIDAKMSYTHYDTYLNGLTSEEKTEGKKKLLLSIKEHLRGLSEKSYQRAEGLDTPDFVLMFIPIESVFSLALESEPALFEEAWKRSVILVSPANLLAILRTIESLWKIEKQGKNTQKIAEEGAALYDKFVDFVKDLENTGKHIKNAKEAFDSSMQKLSEGRGNLIKKAESLKKLGLKTKKNLPVTYTLEEEESLV